MWLRKMSHAQAVSQMRSLKCMVAHASALREGQGQGQGRGKGRNKGQGKGQGKGRNKGQGKGRGKGQGKGKGRGVDWVRQEEKQGMCADFLKHIRLPAKMAKRKRERAAWSNAAQVETT
tara:strand:- start:164 stop:520 length:357 start_codon:yes stop_codon:yes gene_type:complete